MFIRDNLFMWPQSHYSLSWLVLNSFLLPQPSVCTYRLRDHNWLLPVLCMQEETGRGVTCTMRTDYSPESEVSILTNSKGKTHEHAWVLSQVCCELSGSSQQLWVGYCSCIHPNRTRTAPGNQPGAGHTDEWWTERMGRSSIRVASLTLQVWLPSSTLLNTVTETLYMLIFPQIIT